MTGSAVGECVAGDGSGAGECAAATGFGAVECPAAALPQPAASEEPGTEGQPNPA